MSRKCAGSTSREGFGYTAVWKNHARGTQGPAAENSMPRYTVWKEGVISSAHNLRNYKGKCENLHGHNWRVRVSVSGDRLDATGLLIDFADLGRAMEEVCGRLDHIYFNETAPFDKMNPSAENIARYIFEEVDAQLKNERYGVSEVKVWESDGCCAIYKACSEGG